MTAAGIRYVHLPGLGGWRRVTNASERHRALRVAGFRAYAEHLTTPEFRADYARLTDLARAASTAYMCAETLWWRCHRGILSDRLVADGWEVVHLIAAEKSESHRFSDLARVVDGDLVYNAGLTSLELQ